MKKSTTLSVIFLLILLPLGGCGKSSSLSETAITAVPSERLAIPEITVNNPKHPENSVQLSSGDLIEIREKMFISQTNDIYFNAEDYLGKTLKYEGIYSEAEDSETGDTFRSVIRYGPGCCGIDANPGFEVLWDDEYPNRNDWVEAVGVLEEYEVDGYKYLRVALTSLTVLTERGEEYVDQ